MPICIESMRRHRPTEPTARCVWAIAALILACLPLAVPAKYIDLGPSYRIDDCETPLRVHLQGLPDVEGIPLAASVADCGSGHSVRVEPRYDDDDLTTRWTLHRDRMPLIALTVRGGKVDVDVTLREGALPRNYAGRGLEIGSRGQALKRVGHSDGPELRVAIELLKDGPYVGIDASNIGLKQIAADLSRIKRIELRSRDILGDKLATIKLDMVSLGGALSLLADVAGVEVRGEGGSGFEFGTPSHQAELKELRAKADRLWNRKDTATLEKTLRQIIAVAGHPEPGHLRSSAVAEIAWLADLLLGKANDEAADLIRQQLNDIEYFSGSADSPTYALALLDLARVQRLQNDAKSAAATLERALAMLEKEANAESLPARIEVLGTLATMEVEADDVSRTSAHLQEAYSLLDSSDAKYWEPQRLRSARARVSTAALLLGVTYDRQRDHARAEAHLDRALALTGLLKGANDPSADVIRAEIARNAQLRGDTPREVESYQELIHASEGRQQPLSVYFAFASLNLCRIRAEQDHLADAIALMKRFAGQLGSALGPSSPEHQAALGDLSLLYRLAGETALARRLEGELGQARQGATAPVAIDESLRRLLGSRILPGSLEIHYADQIAALASSGKTDELAHARERYAEVLAANGKPALAIAELAALSKERLHIGNADDREVRRLENRLDALCGQLGSDAGDAQTRNVYCTHRGG